MSQFLKYVTKKMQGGGDIGSLPGVLSLSAIQKKIKLDKDIKNQKALNSQATLSQYTPKPGDQERMNRAKDRYRTELTQPLNRAAASQYTANAWNNIVKPMMEMEGIASGVSGVRSLMAKPKRIPTSFYSEPVITRGPIPNPWDGKGMDMGMQGSLDVPEGMMPYIGREEFVPTTAAEKVWASFFNGKARPIPPPYKKQRGGTAYVDSVFSAPNNKQLEWVQRLYQKNGKSIMVPGQTEPSTHFMESGNGRVYPTVVTMPDGSLKYLGKGAYDHADSTKTYIQFPTDNQAQWFGKNYKIGTGVLSKKKGGPIVDPRGQWAHPGKRTIVPTSTGQITMQGVPYPVYGQDETGYGQMMMPGGEYQFPGQMVDEIPVAQNGKQVGWWDSVSKDVKNLFGIEDQVPVKKTVSIPVPKTFNIKDNRKINATTMGSINPNRDLVTGNYDGERVYEIIRAAKRYGVDPYYALAIDLQETSLGNKKDGTEFNIGHLRDDSYEAVPSLVVEGDYGGSLDAQTADYFARTLLAKQKNADRLGIKDPAKRIQVYNGLGKVFPKTEEDYHGFKMKHIYGVPLPKEGIDLSKNPLYGKRIMDLMDNVLKKDQNINNYVRWTKENGGTHPIMQGGGSYRTKEKDASWNWLNPLNWGVPDYSDKGNFDQAYALAKKNNDKQFMYGSKRIAVKDGGKQASYRMIEKANPQFTSKYKLEMQKMHPDDADKRYQDMLDLHLKYGNPKVNMVNEAGRAFFDAPSNAMTIYGMDPIGNYISEMNHARQRVAMGPQAMMKKQAADMKRNKVVSAEDYDNTMYDDLNSIEGVHKKYDFPLTARMLYRDYNLEQDDSSAARAARLKILSNNAAIGDFDPYLNQAHIRAMQRALHENGYALPGSIKADNTFDGVYGKETKAAFEAFKNKQPKMENGGEMIRRADGSYSRRGLWDNIRANKGSGKKPTKEMLEQERKIKAKEMKNGGTNNPGFEALPDYVQAKILSNMGYGGMTYPFMAEGGDPDGQMALGQIDAAIMKLNQLRKFIQPESDLEPWVNSKLTLMDDYATAVSDYMMHNPEAQGEGEEMEEMARGGYVVTRSHDRKGKTHKVTGPDGTVKYFGDSKLGQHPNDPERKKAFYARHKKNLDKNPYFRAFARATWAEGGEIDMMGEGGTNNPGFRALPEYVQQQILSNMAYGGYIGQDGKRHMSKTPTWSGNVGYQMGGEPCYECGGGIYQWGGGPKTIEERSLGDKCGLQRGIDKELRQQNAQAYREQAVYAKQVAKEEKQAAKDAAIAAAAQTSMSHDWTETPLDKKIVKQLNVIRDKYLSDNPNVFVPDDTSGYTPQQKFALATKLMDRANTNMYSEVFKNQFGIPSKGTTDLNKVHSEFIPRMGGWEGVRKWLFTPNDRKYYPKKYGGPTVGAEMDVTPEQLEALRQQGYEFEII